MRELEELWHTFFAVLAMISIGTLGLLSKLADRRGYDPLNTTILLFGTAAAIMATDVLASEKGHFVQPSNVILAGLSFGLLAVLAFWVFLFGLKYGKITTSWVFINLSAAVPGGFIDSPLPREAGAEKNRASCAGRCFDPSAMEGSHGCAASRAGNKARER
jgi:hypothetical protein